MNLRTKIYCIFIIICYIGLFANTLYSDFDEMKTSFTIGHNKEDKTTLSLRIKPNTDNTHPITLLNKQNGETLPIDYTASRILTSIPTKNIPTYLFVIEIVCLIVGLFIIIAFIAFPFLFFNIIYSAVKNKLMSTSVIRNLRIMGGTLIVYYLINIILGYTNMIAVQQLISIEGYTIETPNMEMSIVYLIIGFTMLLLGEILHFSLSMKEEQDLTI